MPVLSRQIRNQSWATIAIGVILFAVFVAIGFTDAGSSDRGVGSFAGLIASLAFVGIGVLGLTTARVVSSVEERLSRLAPSEVREVGSEVGK